MKKKFFRSLKIQLPYSFATISLITTSIIGLVLYFIIWNYYSEMSEKYLDASAYGFAEILTQTANRSGISKEDFLFDYKDILQNEVDLTSFLIQSRVKIMDTDHIVVVDSGSPSVRSEITLPDSDSNAPQSGEERPDEFSIHANTRILGFQLGIQEYNRRVALVVELPFYGQDGDLIGYIELSESPDYSRNIIFNIVGGLLIASLLGISISHLFGFLVARNLNRPLADLEKVALEMKNGNYAIRSTVNDPEELASLSESFNQMAAQIQHNIETLHQFISDASHEIRTPLTALHADLNLAITEKDASKVKLMIERSLEQINRLDQLTKDLLDLSRLESKDDKVNREKINLVDKLMGICEIHASAAEQANIDFQINVSSEPVFINADAHQFQRAVGNLLNNAVKFSRPGGKVVLTMYTESQSAIILVEDEGIGIPKSECDKLFNRFHRGKNTQNYPGSGLGLAIAQTIIENHDGAIGVLPDKEKTIFFIRMPLIQDPPARSSS